jgi:hypothetical protein
VYIAIADLQGCQEPERPADVAVQDRGNHDPASQAQAGDDSTKLFTDLQVFKIANISQTYKF